MVGLDELRKEHTMERFKSQIKTSKNEIYD